MAQRSVKQGIVRVEWRIGYFLAILDRNITNACGTLTHGIVDIVVVFRIYPYPIKSKGKVDMVTGRGVSSPCSIVAQDGWKEWLNNVSDASAFG